MANKTTKEQAEVLVLATEKPQLQLLYQHHNFSTVLSLLDLLF